MSAVLTVKASDLNKAISAINPLFPKGSAAIPIGLYVRKGHLKIVCLQGVVYQADIPVDDDFADYSATIMYYNITPLLPSSGELYLEFTPVSVILTGDGVEAEFSFGYSIVAEQNFSGLVFTSVSSSTYLDSFSHLLNLGLDKLYGLISPVVVMGDVSLQKFPNTWVQVRSNGLPFNATLDIEHVRLITKFMPTQVCTSIPNTLVFKNATSVLQVPCKNNVDNKKITELMSDMGDPIQINIKYYLERIRSMIKVDSKTHCKISIYNTGIKTTVAHENTSISISAGKTDGEVIKVCHLPIQVWSSLLKGLSAETIQILIGGDKLCLRTTTMIIVTRVLL